MKEKTAKALYVLARAVGTCPQTFYKAAKDFVDTYEHEEHERRHVAQEHEQHEQRHEAQACKPKVGEVYRDILGNKYIVTAVHDSFPDDARGNKPFIVLKHVESNGRIALSDYFAPYLEDFMNPTFKKYN